MNHSSSRSRASASSKARALPTLSVIPAGAGTLPDPGQPDTLADGRRNRGGVQWP